MGKYSELLRRATHSVDYWTQVSIRAFVRDLMDRMDNKGVTQAALAEKIGTSPAYISKVMRGEANFTLETMTKLAMAVDGKINVCIVDAIPMARAIDTDRQSAMAPEALTPTLSRKVGEGGVNPHSNPLPQGGRGGRKPSPRPSPAGRERGQETLNPALPLRRERG